MCQNMKRNSYFILNTVWLFVKFKFLTKYSKLYCFLAPFEKGLIRRFEKNFIFEQTSNWLL